MATSILKNERLLERSRSSRGVCVIRPLEYRVADIKYRIIGGVQPRPSIPAPEGRRATGGFERKQFSSLCRKILLL